MSTTDNNNEQQCGDSGEMTLNKEKCTCEQNGVDSITEGINSVTLLDDKSICANCGKEGNDVNNVCNKCKMVKYCNAACKKKHRHKHKKDCDEHLRQAAKLHDIELFKQPKLHHYGDCPICFLRMPSHYMDSTYYSCCGKTICNGCVHAPVYDHQGNEVEYEKCPFCRTPSAASDEEIVKRTMKRVDVGDAQSICRLGVWYSKGFYYGLPQDYDKAIELFHRAGELGFAGAYASIGYAYHYGRGVEIDMVKSIHYELAAMGGDAVARYNLGNYEKKAGNMERALKHYMIGTRDGNYESLDQIMKTYTNGNATKDDYTKALQLYQAYVVEIKSDQRDKAAAADGTIYYQ